MITTAFVNIWNHQAGAIAWDSATQTASFEYTQSFVKKGLDLAPVKMPIRNAVNRVFSFPELRNSNTFRGLPGLLADMLPDKYGNALINTWLARHGRPMDSMNPVELLCFIGNRSMGALEIEPAIPETSSQSTELELEGLIEMAQKILDERTNFATKLSEAEEKSLLDILKIGTSAGGARAKALIAYNQKTGEVRSGQAKAPEGFSQWLIKFDGVTDTQFNASSGYGRVEMAYHNMAVDAGIEMTECRLMEENGRAHFMTRRFDRLDHDEKLHVQSFCALQHFDFNNVLYYSYEQLFQTMRELRLSYIQAEQLYRRMVFNVMGKNCDDHTKNFGFLMNQEGQWRLSPAYDICHAYRPGSDWVQQHALSINGKRKDITKKDLLEVAYPINVKNPTAIISEIAEVVSGWERYSGDVGVEKKLIKAIGKTLTILK
ncbi:MAG: type II toxin-antitoxin system HipA family toxin [Flavobacteriales bacterium]|nr:type II toxin-antitoxin system HipA family toxin [Flavobacteriales bacterium]